VRAALFSLGVVIGLIETGCHRRLRCVASVSGGSILNAALAHARSLASFSSVTDFEPLASSLAASLASRGAFAFEWRTVVSFLWNLFVSFVKALPYVVPIAFALIVSALPQLPDWVPAIFIKFFEVPWIAAIFGVSWQIVSGTALALLLLAIWYLRADFQEARFASVLGAVAGLGQRLYVRDWGASREQGPGVMHVLGTLAISTGVIHSYSRCNHALRSLSSLRTPHAVSKANEKRRGDFRRGEFN
jgi:hypothetical protein